MLTVRLAEAGIGPGSLVLDLGCGAGRHAFACAKAGAHVVAVDPDESALGEVAGLLAAMGEAGEIPEGTRASALAADAARLPFPDGAFDAVIAAEVLEHLADDDAALAELARVVRPGGVIAVSVPRAGPEAVNWVLSPAYHEVEGGHLRIYRRSQLRSRAEAAGLSAGASHHAHALHTPYWWLRCLVGVDRDDHRLVAAYHRFLVYDIVRRPAALRLLERTLDPLLGKSYVLYLRKPAAGTAGTAGTAGRAGTAGTAERAGTAGRGRAAAPGRRSEGAGPPRAGGTRAEVVETARTIAAVQEPSGRIPWFEGGTGDPWNHVEAAMALGAAGDVEGAEAALSWLAGLQRPEGAWHAAYGPGDAVTDDRLDTNGTAYVATGLLHLSLVTGETAVVERHWAMLEAAMGFVLAQQRPGGEIGWSASPPSDPDGFCLLAACSSIHASLRAAGRCAEALGRRWPEVGEAADRLAGAIRHRPSAFLAKGEYAMDWYYPVLSGALVGAPARRRLQEGWATFVQEGRGVLCRSDRRWVTAAETAECALACMAVGRRDEAALLLSWTAAQRQAGGSYVTGLVYPERSEFPPAERTTYTAAAFVLAADALDVEGTGAGAATRSALLPGTRPPAQRGGGRASRARRLPAPSPSRTRNRPEARASS